MRRRGNIQVTRPRRISDFSVLTFDCYGTLIDWEAGILAALDPWLKRVGVDKTPDEILAAFARHESTQEAETPGLLYPKILERVHGRMAGEWHVPADDGDAAAFAGSVKLWPAFPDSADALSYLGRHYRLAILSNVDRASFRASNDRLGVSFDWVFTAEEIGSYKPDRRNFEFMLRELARGGVRREEILHTAQSLYHDHVPAAELGLATNWIDRRHGRTGAGGIPPAPSRAPVDFRHRSMAEFAQRHRKETEAQ